MPKADREVIENKLSEAISKYKASRKFLNKMNKGLNKYNIPLGTFTDISNNPQLRLPDTDIRVLYLIMNEIFKETRDESLEPSVYFHDKEAREAEKYIGNIGFEEVRLPFTFENVIRVQMDDYITAISGQELLKMYMSRLIEYDFETQRLPKYKGMIEVPDVNHKSVVAISEFIANNDYLPDTLTINVYSDTVQPLTYNEKHKSLAINKGAKITILDGFHRLQGLVRAYALNKNIEVMFNLAIKSYDQQTAKRYFGRINMINPVKKARINELMQDRSADKIVSDLQRNSELKGRVASTDKKTRIPGYLTSTEILAEAIHDYYGNMNFIETKRISNYLAEFFNYLLGYFPEEFNPIVLPNDNDPNISHPLVFSGYVWLSKYLLDHEVSVTEVDRYIRLIDFNTPQLKAILSTRATKKLHNSRAAIEEYFKQYLLG